MSPVSGNSPFEVGGIAAALKHHPVMVRFNDHEMRGFNRLGHMLIGLPEVDKDRDAGFSIVEKKTDRLGGIVGDRDRHNLDPVHSRTISHRARLRTKFRAASHGRSGAS